MSAAALLLAASAARAGTPLTEVADLLPGTYVSRDPAGAFRIAVAAVPKSRLTDGAPVFYLEGVRRERPNAPLLQRFFRLEADGARVVLRVYEPRDLAGVRGKWREPEALSLFTARDVRERPDCRMALAKSPAGHWAGGTAAATCASAFAGVPLAVAMSLSPQTLEWREEGMDASGKKVRGPTGEITIYARERETAAPAPAAGVASPPALSAPAAGGAGGEGGISLKVNEAAAQAPAVLEVISPSSPSKKYSLAELQAIARADRVSLKTLVVPTASGNAATSVVVVTSQSGAIAVFAFAEISSSGGPSLDVSGAVPRLVAPAPRALDDVVSIEVRDLGGAP